MQSVYLSKVKASTPSLAQTQARRCLRHSLVASSTLLYTAAHATFQSASASVCSHHEASSDRCCIVFQILESYDSEVRSDAPVYGQLFASNCSPDSRGQLFAGQLIATRPTIIRADNNRTSASAQRSPSTTISALVVELLLSPSTMVCRRRITRWKDGIVASPNCCHTTIQAFGNSSWRLKLN